jgi:hypothetical protein
MILGNFDITIASLPDKEDLVAEIYYMNYQWVEISQETGELIIQFYAPPPEKECWEFCLNDALEVLEKAKQKLLNLRIKRK